MNIKTSSVESGISAVRVSASETAASALTRASVLFFAVLILISAPAFFGWYFISSEQQVPFFGAAYGLRLFFPGSNRILSVLPFVTSWLGTPHLIGIGHFLITTFLTSGALALFAYFLPRAMFYAFGVSLLLLIIVFFGGEMYEFHLNSANPYLAPFSLGLVGCTILLNAWPTRFLPKFALAIVLSTITIAEAGINPSAALLSATFLVLYLAAMLVGYVAEYRLHIATVARRAVQLLRNETRPALGAVLNAVAALTIFWLGSWYKYHFPQYVKSNYSVESYANSGLSLTRLQNAFVYLTQFHDRGGLFGPSVSVYLIAFGLTSGFLSLGLWLFRRRSNPSISRYYFAAFLIWASSIVTIVVLSQNAHVQLVQNMIQGRYYTTPYYAIILSCCLITAAALIDFAPSACPGNWPHADKAWLLVGALLAAGSVFVHVLRGGGLTTDIVQRNPSIIRLAEEIRASGVPAVLGSYWWIWDLQYELNRDTAGAPRVTPVSIRTESFGLSVFNPILEALTSAKSFRFACIELKNPPTGEQDCQEQIESFRFQGGFPLGKISELGRSEIADYKLTFYELGLEQPDDPADCTTSEISLRAKPLPSSTPEQESYSLDEDSFVYLQRPAARSQWVLKFISTMGEEVVTVPRAVRTQLHLLRHSIGVVSAGCRLLITVSHPDGVFPKTMQLVVQR